MFVTFDSLSLSLSLSIYIYIYISARRRKLHATEICVIKPSYKGKKPRDATGKFTRKFAIKTCLGGGEGVTIVFSGLKRSAHIGCYFG